VARTVGWTAVPTEVRAAAGRARTRSAPRAARSLRAAILAPRRSAASIRTAAPPLGTASAWARCRPSAASRALAAAMQGPPTQGPPTQGLPTLGLPTLDLPTLDLPTLDLPTPDLPTPDLPTRVPTAAAVELARIRSAPRAAHSLPAAIRALARSAASIRTAAPPRGTPSAWAKCSPSAVSRAPPAEGMAGPGPTAAAAELARIRSARREAPSPQAAPPVPRRSARTTRTAARRSGTRSASRRCRPTAAPAVLDGSARREGDPGRQRAFALLGRHPVSDQSSSPCPPPESMPSRARFIDLPISR